MARRARLGLLALLAPLAPLVILVLPVLPVVSVLSALLVQPEPPELSGGLDHLVSDPQSSVIVLEVSSMRYLKYIAIALC